MRKKKKLWLDAGKFKSQLNSDNMEKKVRIDYFISQISRQT